MLAERKRKQKWSLNPRGKQWAEDTNKFGQKMLEKMGWTHGKGLGAKENGVTEHIKVSYKNDSKGMGYKDSDDQWTEHQSNFSALLEALGGKKTKSNDLKLSSLEEKSQNSKARVHYKKFTRGKDLSKYSEKDLANIFGKKTLNQDLENNVQEKDNSKIENVQEAAESSFFSNSGSMSDYFKKKLPNFGKSHGYVVGNNGVLKKADETESESELQTNFGFGFKSSETESDDISKKKKKEKKKKVLEESVDGTPTKRKRLEEQEVHEDTPIKKKSKSRLNKTEENGVSNPAFDPLYNPVTVEKHILDTIEETFNESLNSTVGEIGKQFEVNVQINNENTPEVMKYKKKELGTDNENDVKVKKNKNKKRTDTESIDSNFESGQHTSSKQKKKKKNVEEVGLDNPLFNISTESEESSLNQNEEDSTKSKKKRKKKNIEEIGLDNPVFSISIDSEDSSISQDKEDSTKSKKKKKKSKSEKENCGLENPVFNVDEKESSADICNNVAFEVQRKDKSKKKKKKLKEQSVGLDNPALSLNDSIDENCDLMLNIASTPIFQGNNESTGEDFHIKKVNTVTRRKSVRFSDITRERIIPSKEDIEELDTLDHNGEIVEVEGKLNDSFNNIIQKKSKKRRKGLDNDAFDVQANNIEENITSISNTLDSYEAEIENDLNEAKLKSVELNEVMVGEVGNPDGENEALDDGSVKLKFKYAQFRKQPAHMEALVGPKKSYKHLIKGDIVVGFKHSNLHEINGYVKKHVR